MDYKVLAVSYLINGAERNMSFSTASPHSHRPRNPIHMSMVLSTSWSRWQVLEVIERHRVRSIILLMWTFPPPNWLQLCFKHWAALQWKHGPFGKAFCLSARCGQSSQNSWRLYPDVALSWKTNRVYLSLPLDPTEDVLGLVTSWWIC